MDQPRIHSSSFGLRFFFLLSDFCLPVCGCGLVCLASAVIYGLKFSERVPSPRIRKTALESGHQNPHNLLV